MGNVFKFTLYEFFGYLLPGVLGLGAFAIADIVVFHFGRMNAIHWLTSKEGVFAAVCIAYLLGQFMQILANWILPKSNEVVVKANRFPVTKNLMVQVKKDVRFASMQLDDQDIISICDKKVIACGPADEREIYVYREGFYRGSAISLGILSLVLVAVITIPQYSHYPSSWGSSKAEIFVGLILLCILAVGMYFRSLRFANYRIELSLSCYLFPSPRRKGTYTAEDKEGSESSPNDDDDSEN